MPLLSTRADTVWQVPSSAFDEAREANAASRSKQAKAVVKVACAQCKKVMKIKAPMLDDAI